MKISRVRALTMFIAATALFLASPQVSVIATATFPDLPDRFHESTYLKAGDNVPDFALTDLGGNKLSKEDLLGKVTYINFFATWCGPCMSKYPHVEEGVWKKFKADPNFQLINVGREHTKEELEQWRAEKQFASPIAPDPERKFYSLFAEKSIPRTVIIGPDARLLYHGVGYDPDGFASVNEGIAAALAELDEAKTQEERS